MLGEENRICHLNYVVVLAAFLEHSIVSLLLLLAKVLITRLIEQLMVKFAAVVSTGETSILLAGSCLCDLGYLLSWL